MAEFILELFSEEIPARMQAGAATQLQRRLTQELIAARLGYEQLETFVMPRRLTALVTGLPLQQPDYQEERKGPRVNAPDAALNGFLASTGLSKEQLTVVDDKKGAFYVASIHQPGQPSALVLAPLIAKIIREFEWPKSMRWGGYALRWVRPLRGIVAVFDGQPLVGGIDLHTGDYSTSIAAGTLAYGAMTSGHRLSQQSLITVTSIRQYQEALAQAKVILDAAERRQRILTAVAPLAAKAGVTCVPEEKLLDEVVGLVEYPVPLLGRIDAKFMALPPEVLITSMKVHQRYFPCHDKDGALAPCFITVSNNPAATIDSPIIHGNERVLRARLSDALFFWEQDRKQPLSAYVPKLAERIFHEQVGTLADKTERLTKLAGHLAECLYPDAATAAVHAAGLCKADLATGMVGEFPELQGIIGGYYAKADGLSAVVANAIRDHYAPQGEGKPVPTAPVSIIVALADKLDTLVALTVAGVPYSGSKDPYALRRTMLGIMRIATENALDWDILATLNHHTQAFARCVAEPCRDRLYHIAEGYLASRGHRHDIIAALLPTDNSFNIYRLDERCRILQAFLSTLPGQALLMVGKRAGNILKAGANAADFSPTRLNHPAERALWQALQAYDQSTGANYAAQLEALSTLHAPLNQFFTDVLVNETDYAANRHALLAHVRQRLLALANFDKLEGGSE